MCDTIGQAELEPLVNKYAVAGEGGMFVVSKHSPGEWYTRWRQRQIDTDDSCVKVRLVVGEPGLVRHEGWGWTGRPHIERASRTPLAARTCEPREKKFPEKGGST